MGSQKVKSVKNIIFGKINPDLFLFISKYREYGFATKTEMANAAFCELKKKFLKDKRSLLKKRVLEEYVSAQASNLFGSLDSEDFIY